VSSALCQAAVLLKLSTQGVRVPEVLRKYIPGNPEFIEYTRELPKDTTSAKAKDKAPGPKPKVPPPRKTATDQMAELKV
jgi:seryl-tRNA synthetase